MKVYLDYIFFINFLFDFILLFGISLVLKRKVLKIRLLLGSFFGGFSFFIVFLNISSFLFFLIKMILALIMIIITFSYKDLKYTINNFIFLIVLSILLGGCLYLIDIEVGYSHIGMIFFTNGKSLNTILLLIFSVFLIIIYNLYMKNFKLSNSTNYSCKLKIDDYQLELNGYLDTGNNLTYYNRPVLILNKDLITINTYLFVPFNTASGSGIMKGFYSDLEFNNKIYKKVVVVISNDKFHMEGADIILNNKLREEKYENNKIFKRIIKKKK